MTEQTAWVVLALVVGVSLSLDLGIFNRHSKEPTLKSAIGWSIVWVSVALAFNVWVYLSKGAVAGKEFLAGYLLEQSLSVDNLFVISVIFSYFSIPRALQHRVLFWGILGAVVSRGLAVWAGVELLERFEWMTYVFGLFLVYTGWKLLAPHDGDDSLGSESLPIRIARRFVNFTSKIHGEKFFVREEGKLFATPLFLTLIVVETTDVVFAVDSIPAVLGVSRDPFIVYSSNVFAILGLRAMYFVLADAVVRFHYVKHGLAVILTFVGVKMIIAPFYHIPIELSLGLIFATLVVAGLASAWRDRQLQQRREEWETTHHVSHTAERPPQRPGADEPMSWGPTEKVAMLHRLPIFREAAIDDLKEVAQDLYILEFQRDQPVFKQGEPADALYVVLTGQVLVERTHEGHRVELATLGPGQSFGEVALFDDMPRTATVVATERTTVLALARDAFHQLGAKRPAVLMEVIRVLSGRLRDANEHLADREGGLDTAEVPRKANAGSVLT